ncbi:Panacea domain-containing protein [Rathayibacter sp. AY1E6]|uniref:Panacea domain-containing protein n=1 Tax=Rathayibacter sp. AY1E6 TaxID=2080554 RepID=UPI0015E42F57|nr:type II toxin-antitoxin system antitoxin SocA domain-containing protein [Rathayibacter sp. AY1E6]
MKIDDVAALLTERVGAIDAMKLQKLLFYSQAWHLAIHDESLFPDTIEAWRDGPVVDHVYQQHKSGTVRSWSGDANKVEDRARTVVDAVVAQYGSLSGKELSDLTHAEQPWKAARGDLPADARSRRPLSPTLIANFYRDNRTLLGRRAADVSAGGIVILPKSRVPDVAAHWSELDVILKEIRERQTEPAGSVITNKPLSRDTRPPSKRKRTARSSCTSDVSG